MNIVITGQNNFGNHGCEALVKSTVVAFKKKYPEALFKIPSISIKDDIKFWKDYKNYDVEFFDAASPKYRNFIANKLTNLLPKLAPLILKSFWLPQSLKKQIDSADLVLSIGGDNYSLDYGLPFLLYAMDSYAYKNGKKVVLMGASVGPFEALPNIVPVFSNHFKKFSSVNVREEISYDYVTNQMGLTNVKKVPDIAFTLKKEEIDFDSIIKKFDGKNKKLLGFNISPLVKSGANIDLLSEMVSFLEDIIENQDINVILLPHVVPHSAKERNNDYFYMSHIVDKINNKYTGNITLIEPRFNAGQLKNIISRCDYFIGARTHATIAALSSYVPTLSIAYSVKAYGINKEIFGDDRYVVGDGRLNQKELSKYFSNLQVDSSEVVKILKETIPKFQQEVLSFVNE